MDDDQQGRVERWSPVDAVRLVGAGSALVLVLVLDALVGDTLVDVVADLLSGFATIDAGLVTGVAAVTRATLLVALVAGVVGVLRRDRWPFALTTVVAAAGGALLFVLLDGVLDASAPPVLETSGGLATLGSRGFPTAVGLAAVTGVVAAGVPWVSRPLRRTGWVVVLAMAGVRALTAPISFETAVAVLCGAVAGALADAALGVPSRRPTRSGVVAGLGRAGVEVADLHPASVDARGSTPYFGTTTDGRALFVKALGADERKADLLFRLVRSVNPRQLGDERPFSSLRRAVEHEAFLALAADHVGVRTPPFAGLAAAEPGAFVLAYERVDGRSLDGVADTDLTDAVIDGIWAQMRVLREHRIAHRDLRLANVFLAADGEVWLIDFGFSELAAPDLLLANDLAELVLSLALKVGPDRAVDRAVAGVGAEALVAAVPRFAPAYLSGATRAGLKASPGLVDDVRARIARAAP